MIKNNQNATHSKARDTKPFLHLYNSFIKSRVDLFCFYVTNYTLRSLSPFSTFCRIFTGIVYWVAELIAEPWYQSEENENKK